MSPARVPEEAPMGQKIFLPDLEANWKWPRRLNPFTDEIKKECLEWAASFGAFTPEAQKVFDKCKFGLLTGLSYPWLTRDQLRSCCDLMNLFFIFDEHSDKCSPDEVWDMVFVIMDALHNPDKPRPAGEWIGGEVARQYWARATAISTRSFQRRFLESWEEYLRGTAQQAEDRSEHVMRDVQSYLEVRRLTIGAIPSFAMLQMDMDLPDEILSHPVIQELEALAKDLTIVANDVVSYNKEQASGDDEHNLITLAMKEKGLDVQRTIDWAGDWYAAMVTRFNQAYLELPRWGGPLDLDVQCYVNGVAQWVGANVQWSYESERYFGKKGLEVKASRTLHLLPKIASGDGAIGPVAVDDTLL